MPLLEGRRLAERPVYLETMGARGLRTASGKILTRPDGEVEYYDLSQDPGETRPLPCEGDCEPLFEQLALLREWMTPETDEDADDTVELDADDLERLRALGYLND